MPRHHSLIDAQALAGLGEVDWWSRLAETTVSMMAAHRPTGFIRSAIYCAIHVGAIIEGRVY
ncbi:hypothetical protein [Ectopseudomonas mendocina]|jgi:hypothetical protein|uniref:Uncharacterized protein n=1 Tax=Ectopseudomonas mendocina TaxID=300 RepID=A0ABD7RU34_ECTME|nr:MULTISPECIES: hypothetical protein [Pseudomonas]AEB59420.1 hypothetical protein MDS_3389 [Pseudomonas mendocina NK-01]QTN46375.1 hypothetical protein H7683_01745 [Pseudomonas mendocina]TRO11387.1 hypothetical protein EQ829_17395 [Pseudomonas mendocina]TRO16767.1 hypothetical protein EQ836_15975 [Pseudomonas mendocina]TRO32636.1 hypothetical protein EQ832_23060 [Pseudomonas sp. ALS1131]